MKTPKFYLLGKCDQSNPSSIPLDTIQRWEQEGYITYLGESSDVRSIIAQHSCIILPSYREGIPRSLLEAMSMSKPIITTDVSGCKECIKTPQKQENLQIGENGILIPPKDPHTLSCAIKTILKLSDKELKTMGENGRKYAKERFEISHTIQTYLNTVAQYSKTNNLNLVFISNTSFGMYNFRLPILQALQNRGYTIHIIAPLDSSTQLLKDAGFIHHEVKINSKGLNPFEDLCLSFRLAKLLRQINPSLVFNYTIKPAIYASMISNLLKLPNIAIITGLGYVFIEGGIKKKILKKLVCFLYKNALKKTQEVWFLNQDDRDTFLTHSILSQHQAKILNSEGVDTDHFAPIPHDGKEFSFVLIARMLWDKGVGEFIEAIKILKKSHD
ncbi:glycosyltransferase [Helicobacter pametensis]|uniref:glycosyltransferase n=1 Tax=Helicobacter pametensis TaxID=95149 RepID=UPI0004B83B57|nr:glycosyltransferase [Helicobacter pametensis]